MERAEHDDEFHHRQQFPTAGKEWAFHPGRRAPEATTPAGSRRSADEGAASLPAVDGGVVRKCLPELDANAPCLTAGWAPKAQNQEEKWTAFFMANELAGIIQE